MGVITKITLNEINTIFSEYNFTKLTPTVSGVIDTTYIVSTSTKNYILKKYERDIDLKIEQNNKLLNNLSFSELNIPNYIAHNNSWYLYEKLYGSEPKQIKIYHIKALGIFLAKLHSLTYKKYCYGSFIDNYNLVNLLSFTKTNFYTFYKKLAFLKNTTYKNDGLIHGNIFKDNTVFQNKKIGVFDFIDSGCGDFRLDCAVALVAFEKSKNNTYFINVFLNSYNQQAPKKIKKEELLNYIKIARAFYALLRINIYKNTLKAKELL